MRTLASIHLAPQPAIAVSAALAEAAFRSHSFAAEGAAVSGPLLQADIVARARRAGSQAAACFIDSSCMAADARGNSGQLDDSRRRRQTPATGLVVTCMSKPAISGRPLAMAALTSGSCSEAL